MQISITHYWHSEQPPDYITAILSTYRHYNPAMCHRVFSESTARCFIAEHFTGRELTAFNACAVPAMQADYFRYCAMLKWRVRGCRHRLYQAATVPG